MYNHNSFLESKTISIWCSSTLFQKISLQSSEASCGLLNTCVDSGDYCGSCLPEREETTEKEETTW